MTDISTIAGRGTGQIGRMILLRSMASFESDASTGCRASSSLVEEHDAATCSFAKSPQSAVAFGQGTILCGIGRKLVKRHAQILNCGK